MTVCRLRMGLAEAGSPNWALFTEVIQLLNVTWFSTFWDSSRRSRLARSETENVRPREAFHLKWDGPVMQFLPEFPHLPGAGRTKAAAFKYTPG